MIESERGDDKDGMQRRIQHHLSWSLPWTRILFQAFRLRNEGLQEHRLIFLGHVA